jgi:hypothetical protein
MFSRSALMTVGLLLAFLNADDLCAQEGGVTYGFSAPSIEVRLHSGGAAGRIEVVDGSPGLIAVIDRTGKANPEFRLDEAVLSVRHGSGVTAHYRLAVPRSIAVAISVDGQRLASIASAETERNFFWSWQGAKSPSTEIVPRRSLPLPLRHSFVVNAYSGTAVTDSVDVAHPERVRMLKILVGGRGFSVTGNRSVSFGYHEPSRWGVITPRVADAAVTVTLPTDVDFFKVRLGGTVIWETSRGRAQAHCEPVAEIELPGGEGTLWLFTPEDGRLECAVISRPRPV